MEFLGIPIVWWVALLLAAVIVSAIVARTNGPSFAFGGSGLGLIFLGLIFLALYYWAWDVDFLWWLAIISLVVGVIVTIFEVLFWQFPVWGGWGALGAVLLVAFLALIIFNNIDFDNDDKVVEVKTEATVTPTPSAPGVNVPISVKGRVVDSLGNPVEGASVRVSGPYGNPRGATPGNGFTAITDSNGSYEIMNLPGPGRYNLFVLNEGFVPSLKFGGEDLPEFQGSGFQIPDVTVQRLSEFAPPTDTRAYVISVDGGIPAERAVEILHSMGHLPDIEEENVEVIPVTLNGDGRTTVRDGDSISDVPTRFVNEPGYQVTYDDGNGHKVDYFVEKKCGNLAAPPDKVYPPPPIPPPPPPGATPTNTPVPGRPTATPTPVTPGPTRTNTPTHGVTNTPTRTNTPVPPTVTRTPVPTQTPQPTFTPVGPCTKCPTPVTPEPTRAFPTRTPVRNPTAISTPVIPTPTPDRDDPPLKTQVPCTFC